LRLTILQFAQRFFIDAVTFIITPSMLDLEDDDYHEGSLENSHSS